MTAFEVYVAVGIFLSLGSLLDLYVNDRLWQVDWRHLVAFQPIVVLFWPAFVLVALLERD